MTLEKTFNIKVGFKSGIISLHRDCSRRQQNEFKFLNDSLRGPEMQKWTTGKRHLDHGCTCTLCCIDTCETTNMRPIKNVLVLQLMHY